MKSLLIATTLLCTAALSQAEPASYAIDPFHTFVTYEIAHNSISTSRGRFDKKEGAITIDRAAKVGDMNITFDMNAISTGVPALDKELKGERVFNVDKFPSARFVGNKFSFDGDKVSEVGGMLTLKDKTMPVSLKAIRFSCREHSALKREVCGGDFDATIIRSQYGIDFGLNWGLPDAVHLLIQVEAMKQ